MYGGQGNGHVGGDNRFVLKKMRAEEIAYDIHESFMSVRTGVVPTHAMLTRRSLRHYGCIAQKFELDHHRIEVDVDNGRVTCGTVYEIREVHTARRPLYQRSAML